MKRTCLVIAVCLLTAARLEAAPFTAGNIAVLRAEENDNNTTAAIVELTPGVANQAPSNTIAIPGAGSTNLRISGSASSTGYLSHSNNRALLTFTGAANATDTSVNVNTLNPRGVGTLNAAGTFALATTYTGTSGNQTRSATTLNNSTWIIGDQGGIYSNGTNAADPAGNIRSVKAFGGTAYAFTASNTLPPVNTLSAATGGTLTGLPGLAAGTTAAQDFYMIQSGSSGSTYDVLYVLSATSNTVGTLAKFSLVAGAWTSNGTYTTDFGGFGLAARPTAAAPGATLFITSGQGALNGNTVRQAFDAGGFNAAINITTANIVTLYTAPTGTNVKGVDFVPTVPEPATLGLALTTVGAFGGWSRRAARSRGR